MFQVDKAPPPEQDKPVATVVDGTKGLACPKASELPNSLMEEYQTLLSSPDKVHLKPTTKSDDAADLYQILGNNSNLLEFASLKHGGSPDDPKAVRGLLDRDVSRSDYFLNGVRNEASWISKQSTDSKTIFISAHIANESGKDRITSETGNVIEGGTLATGQFAAQFDASGKLTSYKAGHDGSSMVDKTADCADK
jgi:hypothetical protein